ncbi:MAG: carboxylating nicotinate-nucleotide diphosphorylase [Acidobacteria bacterium]|nr:MAG: carboxylating nicotinate-nucleotide diphosphorylase [Acidobacteriota bacterium]REK03130.1 MAG: carboxylating nicotinate-nucleotide diphosphorylase [Acidobacteriota bacterium]REK15416.1 MAG: carboxylating nicotinate-nucleotide diphosphorylase [Acidobacteriota bacterium]REK42134.1 MAG: carboxylating nicotinate-nucleotide diphosphorylase [Acidobacteriota bacterium]
MNLLDNMEILADIGQFLAEDLGRGDITTRSTVPDDVRGRGKFLAKEDLVVCGIWIADAVFAHLDPENPKVETSVADGDEVKEGSVFATLEGYADVLLSGERVALNLLQRLSGIATLSRQFAKAVEGTDAVVVDTRKTTPGLRMMEKYAVNIGGCKNHRFGLDDGVLIKDNHITLAGGVREAVEGARDVAAHLHKIEVEVTNWAQLREAIQAGADIVMLDNQTPDETAKLVGMARDMNPDVLIEASGGMTLDTVRSYAEAGVDLISVGMLTHSARAVDISFKIDIS